MKLSKLTHIKEVYPKTLQYKNTPGYIKSFGVRENCLKTSLTNCYLVKKLA